MVQCSVTNTPLCMLACPGRCRFAQVAQQTLWLLMGLPQGAAAARGLGPSSPHFVQLRVFLEGRPHQGQGQAGAQPRQQGRAALDAAAGQLYDGEPEDLSLPSLWRVPPAQAVATGFGGGAPALRRAASEAVGGGGASPCVGLNVAMLLRPEEVAGSYGVWVRRLAAALLSHCIEPAYRALRRIALLRTQVAELLLPEVVRFLVTSPAVAQQEPELRAVMSQQLAREVLEPAAGMAVDGAVRGEAPAWEQEEAARLGTRLDLRAVALVLRCMENLRRVHREYIKAGAGRASGRTAQQQPQQQQAEVCTEGGTSTRGRRSRGSTGGGAAAATGITGLEPDLWVRVYCLDVDYLTAAAAAVRCHSRLTALAYVEHWFESAAGDGTVLHGLRRLSEGEGKLAEVTPETRARVEALLLDVYGCLGEPDSIYALVGQVGSLGLGQMARLHEHEGNWQAAAQCHDTALQGSMWGHAAAGAEAGGEAAAGLARCLLRMGSCAAALSLLQNRSRQHNHSHNDRQGSEDMLHEVSWRLGVWDTADDAPAPSSSYATAAVQQGTHARADAAASTSSISSTAIASPPAAALQRAALGSQGFHYSVRAALQASHGGDRGGFASALRAATARCLGPLAGGGAAANGKQ